MNGAPFVAKSFERRTFFSALKPVGFNIGEKRFSPLRSAKLVGFTLLLVLVLSTWLSTTAFADDSAKDSFFTAAKSGNISALKKSLQAGVPISSTNEDGYTALMYAAYYGETKAAQFLLDQKADPCAQDQKGNTALMGAIFKGFNDVAHLLIDKCDLNMTNFQQQTPLMYASLFGREEIAKKLIEKGAKTDLKDASGRDAVSLAEGQWNQAMVKILKVTGVIKR